jgi:hypothetical protein
MTLSPAEKVQPKRSTLRSPAGLSAAWSSTQARADPAAIHRAENLDVADWVEPEPFVDTGLD